MKDMITNKAQDGGFIRLLESVLLSLGVGFAPGCGTAPDGDAANDLGVVQSELYPQTDNLWMPAPLRNTTRINLCWQTPGFPVEKSWVRTGVLYSWSSVARVTFNFISSCEGVASDVIPISIEEDVPGTAGLGTDAVQMRLNFTFAAYDPSDGLLNCSTFSGRRSCVRLTAIHEFGHLLGLAHEFNRTGFSCSGDGTSTGRQGAFGDLEIGPVDTFSIMGNCTDKVLLGNDATMLSPDDKKMIQRLYGGLGASIVSGNYFAIRRSSGSYLRFSAETTGPPLNQRTPTTSSHIVEQGGSKNLARISKTAGGRIAYGDLVDIQDLGSGLHYCFVDFGSFGSGVVGLTTPCFWKTVRPAGADGGTDIFVNDPVRFVTPDGLHSLTLDQHLRLLGEFSPD